MRLIMQGVLYHIRDYNALKSELRPPQMIKAEGQLAGGGALDFNNLHLLHEGFCSHPPLAAPFRLGI